MRNAWDDGGARHKAEFVDVSTLGQAPSHVLVQVKLKTLALGIPDAIGHENLCT